MASDRTDSDTTPDSGAAETVIATDPVFLDGQSGRAQPAKDSGSAPASFRGRRERESTQRQARRRRKTLIAVQDGEEEQPNWKKRIVLWVASFAATGYAVSFLIHLLLGILASLYIISEIDNGSFSTLFSMSAEEGDEDFEDIVDASVDMPSLQDPVVEVPNQFMAEPVDVEMVMFASEAQDGGDSGDGGDSVGFEFGRSGKAITKGNFTVWTVPEDPGPREKYVIVIEVKIPENKKLRRYPRSDLVGFVSGTDGYRKRFPTRSEVRVSKYLKIKDGVTRLVVPIPAAERLVRDTIRVESTRILKEKQVIEIEF
ncbi:MAG: hypothetical protein CMJ48_05645 [Planctomycetaceae bacterium]|nr:hypothetical protein [Planctomycetaceae bacterium]